MRPTIQLVVAIAGMVAGAYLIALWVVGLVLIFGFGLLAVNALFVDDGKQPPSVTTLRAHEDVLEQYRQSR